MGLLLRAKIWAAGILCCRPVGRLIGTLTGNRVWNKGCVIDTTNPAIQPSVKAMLLWGLYESAEVRAVHRFLRSDLDVVELGSSLGVVASHIAQRLDRDRRLICVEANEQLLPLIAANVARNAPNASAVVEHGAVDYTAGREFVSLRIGPTNIDSKVEGGNEAGDDGMTVTAPTTTLAGLLQRHQLGEFTLVADIEGAEAGLIAREEEALSRCRQMIIELHDQEYEGTHYTVDAMVDALQSKCGFGLLHRHGSVCVLGR